MKKETLVNHPAPVELPPGNTPLITPIYQTVKFTTETVEAIEHAAKHCIDPSADAGYFYSRISNPTVRQLEQLLAQLQGRKDAIAFGSGVAAVATMLISLLKSGDHVLIFVESYKPTRYLVQGLLAKFGVRSTVLSITDHAAIAREIQAQKSKLVLFESPTNPMLKIADIEAITKLAHDGGALCALDNTFAGVHNHGQYAGIDLFVHSLTKFANGHGDVMGGAIIADEALIRAIKRDSFELGATLDPHAAYLILRGMKTYFLRYRKQCENALEVARFLEAHAGVERVYYPGMKSHPHHELAKKQMHDFGAVISFDVRGDLSAFINRLKLFKLASSLGSTDSLVVPVPAFFAPDLTPEQREQGWITDRSVRISVGIEDAGDLIGDLRRALEG